ncbi:hypothetical protein [Actinoplanes sp. NPDC049599]|uniref:hypothetical protein n=1 Tax=Actinoplanes sp. NPDC049599 TaxID=3363903 RepID=UPI00379780FC
MGRPLASQLRWVARRSRQMIAAEVSEAVIRWAAINGMLRRITRGHPARRQRHRTFIWP